MKQFEVPTFYRSSILARVKAKRKELDPRKKDFSPTEVNLGSFTFVLGRHFGFCYGVENAIERSYKAIAENPGKRIFLLSQMIHNPAVNEDLRANGIEFLQDTQGNQLINFEELSSSDVVLIPAFGTTIKTQNILENLGIDVKTYNTTCPFVEKVWNRSQKLAQGDHTIIIHGKYDHEETKATFSHAQQNGHVLIIKNIQEATFLAQCIRQEKNRDEFEFFFKGKFTPGFNPSVHLRKIGVVNQTTMLASETQQITEFLRNTLISVYGAENINKHMADTRDTLCYATNDNQTSTLQLLEQRADLAIVVGGYNSSNTTHLVELLDQNFNTYFIKDASEIKGNDISHYNIHYKEMQFKKDFLSNEKRQRIVITSGASCPDSILEDVIKNILKIRYKDQEINELINNFKA